MLLLVTVLKDMMNILGLNFLSNFIPFFHHWVMKVNRASNFTQRQKFKDTFAHIILYYMLKDLDEQYSHDLQNYCKALNYSNKYWMLLNIENAKVLGPWH